MLDGFALHEMIFDDQGNPVDYRFLSINPAFEKLTGLEAKKIVGKTVREALPGIESHWIDTYGEVVITGKPILFENYSDGLDRYFEVTAYRPVKNQFVCIFQDITKRKKAKQALKKKTAFLNKIIESSAISLWISDEKGTAIKANPACLKFFGATEEEVIGQYNLFKDEVLLKKGFIPTIKEVFTKKETKTITIDYDFSAVDHVDVEHATHKTLKSIFTPVLDDNEKIANVIVQTIDLTDIKTKEEALRKSRKRYQNLYTRTPAMMHSIDQNGKIVAVSDTWLKKMGYSKEEVLGKKSTYFLSEESMIKATEIALPDFFSKGFCDEVEYTFVKKNGELMDVLLSAISQKDEEGNIIHSLAILQDVTEKLRLENQLRQSHKMEAIGTLSGGIAHDFNNILATILGFADMARDDLPQGSQIKQQLDEVINAGNRAKELVKQILAFSRKTEQKQIPVQVHLLINETLNFLRASIPATIKIELNIAPNCGTILADPTQIHQVLMNLCANAAYAMEDHGGLLSIDLKMVELTVDDLKDKPQQQPGIYLVLIIKDTGTGIKADHLHRIFDPYFTTKEVGKGSGMGLAVVHGIVHSHNGLITHESTEGQGTTFRLFFPQINKFNEITQKTDTSPLPIGKERVLIIDDDESIANLTRRRLEKLGYQTTIKTNSLDALELFLTKPDDFDIVITDQTMPYMTGEELVKKISKIRPDIPLIMCTGYSLKIDQKKATLIGINAFLMKPVEHRELAEAVREALDSSKNTGSTL